MEKTDYKIEYMNNICSFFRFSYKIAEEFGKEIILTELLETYEEIILCHIYCIKYYSNILKFDYKNKIDENEFTKKYEDMMYKLIRDKEKICSCFHDYETIYNCQNGCILSNYQSDYGYRTTDLYEINETQFRKELIRYKTPFKFFFELIEVSEKKDEYFKIYKSAGWL